ncbi:MAG: diacylglycerol kinase [Alphaproteobacteria bacterium]|nr:diacylglycerol kinase [Alphaproteobacteria bacterium]
MAGTSDEHKNSGWAQRTLSALNGVFTGIRRGNKMRLKLMGSGAAILLVAVLWPPPIWWAVVALAIGGVLAAELINSVVDGLAGHIDPDRHAETAALKDMAAGVTLVLNATALVVLFCLLVEML